MDKSSPKTVMLFMAAAVTLLLLLLVWLGSFYWRGKIEKWARNEGLKLVSYHRAWFFEGPPKFVRSRNQSAFRVMVEDRNGVRRTAWLLFGTSGGFYWGAPLTKVEWTADNKI